MSLAGCDQAPSAAAEKGPTLTVTTVLAQSRALARQVVASGSVVPWEEIVVSAEAQGLAVVEMLVDEGDSVTAGQVLLRLNDSVIKAQRDQQVANLSAAKAALAEAEANLRRTRDLQARGNASQQALDERLAAQRTAAAQVAVAEAARAEIEARLAQAVIAAPVAGTVAVRSINLGQVVSPGVELFRLIRDGRLELDAEVPETEFATLAPGLAASVRAEGLAVPVPARIRSLAPRVDARTRLGVAHIALPAGSGLRPGMFATATIDRGEVAVVMVPQTSVIWRDGAEGVFIVGTDGVAHFRAVETGLRRDGAVEIRQGLAAGEPVAVQGAGFLEDGDHVGVVEARR
ncbi:efflux RND transporter periplasmic adaptor subunit [Oleomonas cavernae]|uniref:efflux RND transporter periplasmic adaptor subunit n=1 Tax=Oleomonas cavernae TaxID=2320859 RepID=UPI0013147E01|nr:efflux RND transporter periplasmic adaptor subunit [Oleomonas cavernae]